MPTTPADEMKSGDHRRSLVALRDVLVDHLLAAEPSVSAQIAARLQAVLNDLAAMPAVAAQSKTDELRARRAARKTA